MIIDPREFSELKNHLSEAVSDLEKKYSYAEAFFSEEEGLSIGVSDKETNINEIPARRGVVLNIFNGSYSCEIATSDTSEKGIASIVKNACATIPLTPEKYTLDPGNRLTRDFISSFKQNPSEIDLPSKLAELESIRQKTQHMSKRVVSTFVRYSEKVSRKIFVNRHRQLTQQLLRTACVPVVIVSDGMSSKINHAGNGKTAGYEIVNISDSILNQMVEEAESLLGIPPVEPGVYTLISGPGLSGVIAHEAFGHGVESDLFLKRRAKAVEFMGKSVASPLVNLYDSPAWPGEAGSYFFDDEGVIASETCIIEKGILKRAITDHRSSVLLNLPRTANGRRESFAKKVYTRMSNTYFGRGAQPLDDMIQSIDRGLFLPKGSNGMEDPKNWGIQAESPYAVEIKNGKLTDRKFAPIVITGFVPELLKSISMVGPEIEFEGMGICQKGHKEQVHVAIGGPFMKMRARVG
ncbi:TldD/PmbA family protein [bacterium]|nr:TldD/PmbA family protein [candidate division CSSED10-310 bacterium]